MVLNVTKIPTSNTSLNFKPTSQPSGFGGYSSQQAQSQALNAAIQESQRLNPEQFIDKKTGKTYSYVNKIQQANPMQGPIKLQKVPSISKIEQIPKTFKSTTEFQGPIQPVKTVQTLQGPVDISKSKVLNQQQFYKQQQQRNQQVQYKQQQAPQTKQTYNEYSGNVGGQIQDVALNTFNEVGKGVRNVGEDYLNIADFEYEDKSLINRSIGQSLEGNFEEAGKTITSNPARLGGELLVEIPLTLLPVGPILKGSKIAIAAGKSAIKQLITNPNFLSFATKAEKVNLEKIADKTILKNKKFTKTDVDKINKMTKKYTGINEPLGSENAFKVGGDPRNKKVKANQFFNTLKTDKIPGGVKKSTPLSIKQQEAKAIKELQNIANDPNSSIKQKTNALTILETYAKAGVINRDDSFNIIKKSKNIFKRNNDGTVETIKIIDKFGDEISRIEKGVESVIKPKETFVIPGKKATVFGGNRIKKSEGILFKSSPSEVSFSGKDMQTQIKNLGKPVQFGVKKGSTSSNIKISNKGSYGNILEDSTSGYANYLDPTSMVINPSGKVYKIGKLDKLFGNSVEKEAINTINHESVVHNVPSSMGLGKKTSTQGDNLAYGGKDGMNWDIVEKYRKTIDKNINYGDVFPNRLEQTKHIIGDNIDKGLNVVIGVGGLSLPLAVVNAVDNKKKEKYNDNFKAETGDSIKYMNRKGGVVQIKITKKDKSDSRIINIPADRFDKSIKDPNAVITKYNKTNKPSKLTTKKQTLGSTFNNLSIIPSVPEAEAFPGLGPVVKGVIKSTKNKIVKNKPQPDPPTGGSWTWNEKTGKWVEASMKGPIKPKNIGIDVNKNPSYIASAGTIAGVSVYSLSPQQEAEAFPGLGPIVKGTIKTTNKIVQKTAKQLEVQKAKEQAIRKQYIVNANEIGYSKAGALTAKQFKMKTTQVNKLVNDLKPGKGKAGEIQKRANTVFANDKSHTEKLTLGGIGAGIAGAFAGFGQLPKAHADRGDSYTPSTKSKDSVFGNIAPWLNLSQNNNTKPQNNTKQQMGGINYIINNTETLFDKSFNSFNNTKINQRDLSKEQQEKSLLYNQKTGVLKSEEAKMKNNIKNQTQKQGKHYKINMGGDEKGKQKYVPIYDKYGQRDFMAEQKAYAPNKTGAGMVKQKDKKIVSAVSRDQFNKQNQNLNSSFNKKIKYGTNITKTTNNPYKLGNFSNPWFGKNKPYGKESSK